MAEIKNILVTGASGQLGRSIKDISNGYIYKFIFKSRDELNITDLTALISFFDKNEIFVVINCAAYTDVIEAEINKKEAKIVNSESPDKLAFLCKKKDIRLIHISTDYVFDGQKTEPYNEADITNPLNYYGLTKLEGEKNILKHQLRNSIIIRTSWLYSKYENNFVKSILKKIKSNDEIYVTSNEYGSPTNAIDLAKAILDLIPQIINSNTEIYHFANVGVCSRLEFAKYINEITGCRAVIKSSEKSNLKLIRPRFSALNSKKITKKFKLKIDLWKTSLKKYLANEI